jgi:hypothetical protein
MQEKPGPPSAATAHHPAPTAMSPEEVRAAKFRKQRLLLALKELLAAHEEFKVEERRARTITIGDVLAALFLTGGVLALLWFLSKFFGL